MISQTFSAAENRTAGPFSFQKLERSKLGGVQSPNDGTVRRIKGVSLATRSSDAAARLYRRSKIRQASH
jgi:hypothetical protein